jgi:hypothetical protein
MCNVALMVGLIALMVGLIMRARMPQCGETFCGVLGML